MVNKALRRTLMSTAAFLSIAGVTSCGGDDPDSAEWLFVQTAEIGSMSSPTSLVMPAGESIFGFTDRPNRGHVYLSPTLFAGLWDDGIEGGFAEDPPNAVVTWFDGGEDLDSGVVREVEVLVTAAEYSELNGTIRYSITIEEGQLPDGPMRHVSFFVDDAQLKCGDNCPPECSDPWISFNFPQCAEVTIFDDPDTSSRDYDLNVTIDCGNVLLQWDPPGSKYTGGAAITGYTVQSSPNGTDWTTEIASTPDADNPVTISNLSDPDSYQFRVAALTSNGTGVFSDPQSPFDWDDCDPDYGKTDPNAA